MCGNVDRTCCFFSVFVSGGGKTLSSPENKGLCIDSRDFCLLAELSRDDLPND
jgi:hypothetical protein